MGEEVLPHLELDVAGGADEDPAGEEEEDGVGGREGEDRRAGDGDPPEGISVAVAFYGLRSQDDNPSIMEADDNYCFVAVGSAFSLVGCGAGPETPFMLTVLEPSPGIATPICASFLDLSERGAYRLSQVMEQSAENLAQWLVNGVLGGR